MKKLGLAAFAATLLALLLSCGSSTPAPAAQAAPGQDAPAQAAPGQAAYFTCEGGRGTRLAVMLPDAVGLDADHGYLPDVVQGVLVRDLSRFSAMYVLDRQRLEAIMMELEEAGINQTSEDFFRQREQAADVDYFLMGSITRTATGHTLQFQVTGGREANMGLTRAAFTEALTVAQMDDHTGIHRASTELLTGMGVALTYTARAELGRAEARQTINAQVALAQGINAQRGGTMIEALSRYIQATQHDPALAEATRRLNTLSANVRSGNIREAVRDEMLLYNEWLDTVREANEFFVDHTRRPLPLNLVYTTNIRQGNVNWDTGRVDLYGITLALYPDLSWFDRVNSVLATVKTGLNSAQSGRNWGITWPLDGSRARDLTTGRLVHSLDPPFVPNYNAIWVTVELSNDRGMVVGRQTVGIPYGWEIVSNRAYRGAVATGITGFGLVPIAVNPMPLVFPAVHYEYASPPFAVRVSAINGVPAEQAAAQRNISVMTQIVFMVTQAPHYRRWGEFRQQARGRSLGATTPHVLHRTSRHTGSAPRAEFALDPPVPPAAQGVLPNPRTVLTLHYQSGGRMPFIDVFGGGTSRRHQLQ